MNKINFYHNVSGIDRTGSINIKICNQEIIIAGKYAEFHAEAIACLLAKK